MSEIQRRIDGLKDRFPNIKMTYSLEQFDDYQFVNYLASNGIDISFSKIADIKVIEDIKCQDIDIIDDCISRTKKTIKQSYGYNDLIIVDSVNEFNKIMNESKDCRIVLCLKVNDIEKGLDIEECEEILNNYDCNIEGIKIYPENCEDLKTLCKILDYADMKNYVIKQVYIGNSFLTSNKDVSSIRQQFQDISLKYHFNIATEICEYLLYNSSFLICNITGKRQRNKVNYLYINDGIYHSLHYSFLNGIDFKLKDISNKNSNIIKTTIFGPTCDSIDTICTDMLLPDMEIGDWLCFSGFDLNCKNTTKFNSFNNSKIVYIIN